MCLCGNAAGITDRLPELVFHTRDERGWPVTIRVPNLPPDEDEAG